MFPYPSPQRIIFSAIIDILRKKTHYANTGELNQTIKTRDNVCEKKMMLEGTYYADKMISRSLFNEKESRNFHIGIAEEGKHVN